VRAVPSRYTASFLNWELDHSASLSAFLDPWTILRMTNGKWNRDRKGADHGKARQFRDSHAPRSQTRSLSAAAGVAQVSLAHPNAHAVQLRSKAREITRRACPGSSIRGRSCG
jgi:hypothetical protein